MLFLVSSILLISSIFLSVEGFGVGQALQRHHIRESSSVTRLHLLHVDASSHVEISDAIQTMWISTIDSDIANIQLEEFRKVFAGGIAVMIGGFISTTLIGTIIEKKDLYANLAAESYIEMADDPSFWEKMTADMSPEEQEKAKELMAKIKAQRESESGEQPLAMSSEIAQPKARTETEPASSPHAPVETTKDVTAKASNDMFSDY